MRGIYKISCDQEDKVYIGSSTDIDRRWREHRRMLNAETHHCAALQLAWDAYGDESFSFETVELCDNIVLAEQSWLDKHNHHCYNTSLQAHNPMANPEVVKRMLETTRKNGSRSSQKLTENQILEIVELLSKDLTVADIASKYMISASTIYQIRSGQKWSYLTGIAYNASGRVTEEEVLRITELLKNGVSVADIAKQYEVCAETIYRIRSGKRWSELTGITHTEYNKNQLSVVERDITTMYRKLTPSDVTQIKLRLRDTSDTAEMIAQDYSVQQSMIAAIRTGRRWAHIKVEGFTEGKQLKSTDCIDEIIALKSQGLTNVEIAKQLGLKSPSTISYALSKVAPAK